MALEKEKKRKRGEILMTQSYKMEDAHKLKLYLDKHNGTKIFLKSHFLYGSHTLRRCSKLRAALELRAALGTFLLQENLILFTKTFL